MHNFAVVSMPASLLVVCVCCGFHSIYELVAAIGTYTCPVLLGLLQLSNQKQSSCKKRCGPQKGLGEKRCEIQGGGQEMAVMVG